MSTNATSESWLACNIRSKSVPAWYDNCIFTRMFPKFHDLFHWLAYEPEYKKMNLTQQESPNWINTYINYINIATILIFDWIYVSFWLVQQNDSNTFLISDLAFNNALCTYGIFWPLRQQKVHCEYPNQNSCFYLDS